MVTVRIPHTVSPFQVELSTRKSAVYIRPNTVEEFTDEEWNILVTQMPKLVESFHVINVSMPTKKVEAITFISAEKEVEPKDNSFKKKIGK